MTAPDEAVVGCGDGVYYEVQYWDGKNKVETFIRLFVARNRFDELYKAHGYYNLKLIKYVTTAEVLDKGYERNVSMMKEPTA